MYGNPCNLSAAGEFTVSSKRASFTKSADLSRRSLSGDGSKKHQKRVKSGQKNQNSFKKIKNFPKFLKFRLKLLPEGTYKKKSFENKGLMHPRA